MGQRVAENKSLRQCCVVLIDEVCTFQIRKQAKQDFTREIGSPL
jgi:hypothetical protein